ncbi:MAG: L,D-transpeptidase [Acidobacteria bacterium]|nr:MAG: L,D-transpeptidase [Acidobacteriota bacterium]
MMRAGVNNTRSASGWLVAAALLLTTPAVSQHTVAASASPSHQKRHVVVSIPDRKLALLENGAVLMVFPIAVGADASPSPTGQFQIVTRLANPTYYHPGLVIPPGLDNPIGTRWLGLNTKGYGIHGTNAPRSIGEATSHGCVRMRNRDIKVVGPATSVAQAEVPQDQPAEAQETTSQLAGNVETSNKP